MKRIQNQSERLGGTSTGSLRNQSGVMMIS
jgi:hypothetical protein